MNFNSIKKIFTILKIKNFLYLFIVLIILLEVLFQILALTKNNFITKPILFFNPYCDQAYWSNQQSSYFDNKIYKYHPVLSIVKKNKEIPLLEIKKNFKKKKKQNLIFYGSSFIDHDLFIKFYKDNENYAVKSYGFDQIYLSYALTKNNHYGDLVVVGFLLEDLDRVLFNKRNYNKVIYYKKDNKFVLNGYPVDLDKKINRSNYFYSYHFFKSIFFLFLNDYDYKKSKCKIGFKKDLFEYLINKIKKDSETLNQNLIIVSFNFREDIGKNDNWRYDFIKDFLYLNNIHHIDTKKIIEEHMKINNFSVDKYYSGEDLHFNNLANKIFIEKLNEAIMQYR